MTYEQHKDLKLEELQRLSVLELFVSLGSFIKSSLAVKDSGKRWENLWQQLEKSEKRWEKDNTFQVAVTKR